MSIKDEIGDRAMAVMDQVNDLYGESASADTIGVLIRVRVTDDQGNTRTELLTNFGKATSSEAIGMMEFAKHRLLNR